MRTNLRKKGQLTLPREVVEKAHLREGDLLEVELDPSGVIVLRPKKVIDASQTWFWTPTWQAGEREASEEIDDGRVRVFTSDEEFLASLDD